MVSNSNPGNVGTPVVAIGASAGGLQAIQEVIRGLPADFPAPILVVLHLSPHERSMLPAILSRAGALKAVHPEEGARLSAGTIYVAPPDIHLALHRNVVHLHRGPRVNRSRPSIDVTFSSIARWCGRGAVGVLLSGTLDDGTAGLAAINRQGGMTIVQDPDDALFPSMPRNAIEGGGVIDVVAKASEIASVLIERFADSSVPRATAAQTIRGEERQMADAKSNTDGAPDAEAMVDRDFDQQTSGNRDGQPSIFTCPDCSGVTWEYRDGPSLRFRCHVGHELGSETMFLGGTEAVERALWTAIRSLMENAALSRRLERHATEAGRYRSAPAYAEQAIEAEHHAAVIRSLVTSVKASSERPRRGDADGGAGTNRTGGEPRTLEARPTAGGVD